MSEIQKIAVIGSGVMGSGIAALCANAGLDVVLLDIVPGSEFSGQSSVVSGESDASPSGANTKNSAEQTQRNILAISAIEKQQKAKPPGFTHTRNAKRIRAGNLEDNLDWLKDRDLIIEAVLEKLEVKQAVYKQIDSVRKKGAVVSSNTSTIPLQFLVQGLSDDFAQHFMITHFFNPPRFMRLLEVLPSPSMKEDVFARVAEFGEKHLGKGVVRCKDTPGFLANRIGVYWMTVGLLEALDMNLPVEVADAVMGKPLGMPKTGLFALYDLIGIDLMPLIAQAMLATLPKGDAFRTAYTLPKRVEAMIAEGYIGRKGKGGFYRLNEDANGKRVKESINLETGGYAPSITPKLESISAARDGLSALLTHKDQGGEYARRVMVKSLHYAASLVGEISDDIYAIDQAMQLGYNWKYGPFALIDRLKANGKTGSDNFAALCAQMGLDVPPIIQAARGKTLYEERADAPYQFLPNGEYAAITPPKGSVMMADVKRGQKPLHQTATAQLWDGGDGIAILSLTSKMNTWDPENLKLVEKLPKLVSGNFKGLVVATDLDHFSFGANIGYFMLACNTASWWAISDMIKQGQRAFMGLKYAPFPVVASLSGMALGGGCELLLHCDAVQAHMESYPGLVEAGIGVIPGWGGCKELLLRHAGQSLVSSSQSSVVRGQSNAALSGAKKGGQQTASAESRAPAPAEHRTDVRSVEQTKKLQQTASAESRAPAPAEHRTDVRSAEQSKISAGGAMPAISKAFEYISIAKVAGSADEARDMLILNAASRISMNRTRVLADAKQLCTELAENYTPPNLEESVVHLPGKSGHAALMMAVENFVRQGKATLHDAEVASRLAAVLTGGDTDITETVSEWDLLNLEHDLFMELVHMKPTQDRIAHMLRTNKPLRN